MSADSIIRVKESLAREYINEQKNYDWGIVRYLTYSICYELKFDERCCGKTIYRVFLEQSQIMDKLIEAYGEEELQKFLRDFIEVYESYFISFIRLVDLESVYKKAYRADYVDICGESNHYYFHYFRERAINEISNNCDIRLKKYLDSIGKQDLFTEKTVDNILIWCFGELSRCKPNKEQLYCDSFDEISDKFLLNNLFENIAELAMLLDVEESKRAETFEYIVTEVADIEDHKRQKGVFCSSSYYTDNRRKIEGAVKIYNADKKDGPMKKTEKEVLEARLEACQNLISEYIKKIDSYKRILALYKKKAKELDKIKEKLNAISLY